MQGNGHTADAGRIAPMARILITGSNCGFGPPTTLARQGHDVIATMCNLAKSDAPDHAVAAEELSITKRTLDVADQASVDAALADAHDIDVLINNAATRCSRQWSNSPTS